MLSTGGHLNTHLIMGCREARTARRALQSLLLALPQRLDHALARFVSHLPLHSHSYRSVQNPHPLSQVYSFVPIPGAQQHKRPRRRYEEIERMYKCGWNGCEKAYGTLNHLNAHVTMQSHGTKRTPEGEFLSISRRNTCTCRGLETWVKCVAKSYFWLGCALYWCMVVLVIVTQRKCLRWSALVALFCTLRPTPKCIASISHAGTSCKIFSVIPSLFPLSSSSPSSSYLTRQSIWMLRHLYVCLHLL